jgi:hypothetical protein
MNAKVAAEVKKHFSVEDITISLNGEFFEVEMYRGSCSVAPEGKKHGSRSGTSSKIPNLRNLRFGT